MMLLLYPCFESSAGFKLRPHPKEPQVTAFRQEAKGHAPSGNKAVGPQAQTQHLHEYHAECIIMGVVVFLRCLEGPSILHTNEAPAKEKQTHTSHSLEWFCIERLPHVVEALHDL